MEENRVLAYTVSTPVDTKELDEVAGGTSSHVVFPSIIVTGSPILPDTMPDRT